MRNRSHPTGVLRVDMVVVDIVNQHAKRTGLSTSLAFWELFVLVDEKAPVEPKSDEGRDIHEPVVGQPS